MDGLLTTNTTGRLCDHGHSRPLGYVQLILAVRHDRVVTAQGPIATIEALQSQIEVKQNTLG